MGAPREIVILGSTGSVGTQAIDIVQRNPDKFRVAGIAAGGSDPAMLAAQALELGVDVVAVAKAAAAQDLLLAFYAEAQRRGFSAGEYAVPKVLAGPDAATRDRRPRLRRGAERHHRARSGFGPPSRHSPPGGSWRWPTRSR